MLFLGVPVVGLFGAPVDQRGEWQGWACEWKLLWRRTERTRRSVRPGRMWHVLESVSKGIPGGGHHIWLLYVRHWKLKRDRREYVSVERIQWKPKQGQWPRDRYHPLSVRLAGRCSPIPSFISSSTNNLIVNIFYIVICICHVKKKCLIFNVFRVWIRIFFRNS